MDTPWIIIHDGTKGEMAYAMECLRCGGIQKVVTPIGIDMLSAMVKVFARKHRKCRERAIRGEL